MKNIIIYNTWTSLFKKTNLRETPYRMHRFLNNMFLFNKEILGVEIGVCDGINSAAMLKSCNRLNLVCVDPWWLHVAKQSSYAYDPSVAPKKVHEDFNKRFKDLEFCRKTFNNAINNLKPYMDRVKIFPMFSVEASLIFAQKELDFVYLDGDHSYLGLMEDLNTWYPKIKRNGYLCGHDYDYDESGVKRAVIEFSNKYKLKFIHSTYPAHEWIMQIK